MYANAQSRFSFSDDTVSIFIAPSTIIIETLDKYLCKTRGQVLYICGNYPEILPSLTIDSDRCKVRRALTAYQVLSILKETDEPLTLFEHDRSLYDDNADLLIPIGERCRQRGKESGTVVLFAVRSDPWLNQLEPYANRVAYFTQFHPISVKGIRSVPSKQHTLEGL